MQVMFVDDESRVLSGIERTFALHDNDWTCRFATSGPEALAQMEALPADVVVSDMRMPFMDGAEFLGRVRDRWPGTIRIILSGYSDKEATLRMLDVAHQFLAKPCSNDVLLATVEKAMGLRRLFSNPRVLGALGRTTRLPAAPRVFTEVCRLLADPTSDSRRIADLLGSDPALSAKLMQLANSSYFAGGNLIRDVGHAIARLGLDQVGLLVLASQVFGDTADPYVDRLQQRAMTAATLAAHIASRHGPETTAALLAHIGLLVPELREGDLDVPAPEGIPMHAAVGAYLLALWGLPMEMVDAVTNHHAPAFSEPGFGLAGVVHVAVALANEEAPDMDYLQEVGVLERLPQWQQFHQRLQEKTHA
jgi:HD-like signal output (HDOD) protein/ActR/RegA family two-component response regulator